MAAATAGGMAVSNTIEEEWFTIEEEKKRKMRVFHLSFVF